jgi:hypothetical protein
MRLSQLIAELQAMMDEHGDAERVALCVARGGEVPRRADFHGDIEVQHDNANYPRGMVYLVVDAKETAKRRPSVKKVTEDDEEPVCPRISHPKPGVTVHRCR